MLAAMRNLAARLRRAPAALPPEPSATAPLLDLLGRPPISLDTPELQRFLAGKSILVTGAGGSIGSEICRQAMKFCPRRLILLDRAENALFEIHRELRDQWIGATLRPCLADICDAPRIQRIFSAETPDVIFHAAAHKHVPMMEDNPGEAVKNNVFGTRIVADAAADAGAHAFVLISTDKAVNPTSVMGAAKRCAELYIQSLNHASPAPRPLLGHEPRAAASSTTRFLAVRFGNVLGSSGSVVPIFQKQIAAGGPVTITHPDMQRYFMSIPEASQLVMQAGAIGHGGEIFILDMGRPIRILDLAREMILRAGLCPDDDIAIRFTGIRPGEKLHEQLASDDEQTRPTSHQKIRVWQLPPASPHDAARMLRLLAPAIDAPRDQVVAALRQAVPEYQPTPTPLPAPQDPPTPPLRLARDSQAIRAA